MWDTLQMEINNSRKIVVMIVVGIIVVLVIILVISTQLIWPEWGNSKKGGEGVCPLFKYICQMVVAIWWIKQREWNGRVLC